MRGFNFRNDHACTSFSCLIPPRHLSYLHKKVFAHFTDLSEFAQLHPRIHIPFRHYFISRQSGHILYFIESLLSVKRIRTFVRYWIWLKLMNVFSPSSTYICFLNFSGWRYETKFSINSRNCCKTNSKIASSSKRVFSSASNDDIDMYKLLTTESNEFIRIKYKCYSCLKSTYFDQEFITYLHFIIITSLFQGAQRVDIWLQIFQFCHHYV